jgi:hypothetical protein
MDRKIALNFVEAKEKHTDFHCTSFEEFNKWIANCKKRIFSYSSPKDRLLLLASLIASIAAGASLPLMNILFGT